MGRREGRKHVLSFFEFVARCIRIEHSCKLSDVKVVATPGTDDVGGPKASQISELRRTAKWHDSLELVREEDDLLTGEELKLFQSVAARFSFLAMDRQDLSYSADAENGFTSYARPHCPQENCAVHNQIPANDLQMSMDPYGHQY